MTMLGAGAVIVAVAVAAVGFLWVLPSWRVYRRRSVVTCPRRARPPGFTSTRRAWRVPRGWGLWIFA